MSRATQECLILRPQVTRADVEAGLAAAGLAHFATHPADRDLRAYAQVWVTPSVAAPTAGVHYYEDPIPNFPYLVVSGANFQDLAARVAERVATFTRDELLDGALDAAAHNDQVRAINRLAIGFVEFDPAVWTIIATFAREAQNPLLREAAVNSVAFRAWPHYRPLLERIVVDDPSENVRQRAALLLAHWPSGATDT
jgi:hypothetical protein